MIPVIYIITIYAIGTVVYPILRIRTFIEQRRAIIKHNDELDLLANTIMKWADDDTDTGKELAAQFIRDTEKKKRNYFVEFFCTLAILSLLWPIIIIDSIGN